MKHLFIVNPVAGGKDRREYVAEQARRALEGSEDAYELYVTTAPMDACVKIAAEAASGEELRVYACGGDGTLNECVNGAAGRSNVAVTHFPCGMEYSGGTSLICACNGRFYGGGFNPIPDSMPDNGKLEFLVVRDVSRLTFIRLVGKYAKGRYRELEQYITHLEGDHLEIDSENEIVVNIDGEALYGKHVNFDLIPGGVNFLVPANMAFFHPETAGGHETREFVHT